MSQAQIDAAVALLLKVKVSDPSAFRRALEVLSTSIPPEFPAEYDTDPNPKGALQTFAQQTNLVIPEYKAYQSSTGPSHDPVHYQQCRLVLKDGTVLVTKGTGRGRKNAEKEAAREMLRKIEVLNRPAPPWRVSPEEIDEDSIRKLCFQFKTEL